MNKESRINRLIEQIEKTIGFDNIEIVSSSEESLLLKRKSDSNKEYTSVSILVIGAEPKAYSVQVEIPNPNVYLLGIDIPFVSDSLSMEEVLNTIGKYLLTS